MANVFSYELDGNIYINLTNYCSNRCTFCVRNGKKSYYGNELWLQKEPTVEEIIDSIDFTKDYKQAVFCGFGEPTYRIETTCKVATELKKRGLITRLNTNGQGNLIHGRDITDDIKGCIDVVNVSLNAPENDEYDKVCLSIFPNAFEGMLQFAKLLKEKGVSVIFSIVDCIGEERVQKCQTLADSLGIPLKIREFIKDS